MAGEDGHDGQNNRDRHEGHDDHDGHDGRSRRRFRMRLPSPLSDDEEHAMTRTIDCAMHVHKALGPGFLESIYEKAMCVALAKAGLAFECEKPIDVMYDGVALRGQRVDLIVDRRVVVELKSVSRLDPIHEAQVVSYLRTLSLRAGLLVNFRVPLLHQGPEADRRGTRDAEGYLLFVLVAPVVSLGGPTSKNILGGSL